MGTHRTYVNLGVKKEKYEIDNAKAIHDSFIEKVRDELDKIDMTGKIYEGMKELYFAIDYELLSDSNTAKKLLEIAKSDFASINYYGILADLGTYDYKEIVEILKNDVNEYEGYKTKDNRKNRREKYLQKHPEKRNVEIEKE